MSGSISRPLRDRAIGFRSTDPEISGIGKEFATTRIEKSIQKETKKETIVHHEKEDEIPSCSQDIEGNGTTKPQPTKLEPTR
jgi:hypothetical protein